MKKLLLCLYFLTVIFSGIAQVAINTNGTAANSSAMLDVQSTSKGVLLSRMTTAQRIAIASPTSGLLVYDTDQQALYMYDGYGWMSFAFANTETGAVLKPLIAMDVLPGDVFGYDVDIDGGYAVVSAPWAAVNGINDRGAAYVFVKENGIWKQQAKLIASDGVYADYFGYNVAISGNHIVVSGSGNRKFAYVFERNGSNWTQQTNLLPFDIGFANKYGSSVAIDGTTIVVGAEEGTTSNVSKGSAYVFELTNNVWTQVQKLIASDGVVNDFFGCEVAIQNGTVAVGAKYADYSGSPDVGSIYVFVKNGGSYAQQAKLLFVGYHADDKLGSVIRIDGNILVAGAPEGFVSPINSGGYVIVFKRTGTTWAAVRQITSPATGQSTNDMRFGESLSLHNGNLFIGSYGEMVSDITLAGAVYQYVLNNNDFFLKKRITDPNPGFYNYFGKSLATDGADYIISSDRLYVDPMGKVLFGKIY